LIKGFELGEFLVEKLEVDFYGLVKGARFLKQIRDTFFVVEIAADFEARIKRIIVGLEFYQDLRFFELAE
jgi:hypothetical protein